MPPMAIFHAASRSPTAGAGSARDSRGRCRPGTTALKPWAAANHRAAANSCSMIRDLPDRQWSVSRARRSSARSQSAEERSAVAHRGLPVPFVSQSAQRHAAIATVESATAASKGQQRAQRITRDSRGDRRPDGERSLVPGNDCLPVPLRSRHSLRQPTTRLLGAFLHRFRHDVPQVSQETYGLYGNVSSAIRVHSLLLDRRGGGRARNGAVKAGTNRHPESGIQWRS